MKKIWLTLAATSVLGLSTLSGCAPAAQNMTASQPESAAAPAPGSGAELVAQADGEASKSADGAATSSTAQAKTKPQLIKRASLTLSMEALDKGLAQIQDIVAEQQGDLLAMNDQSTERYISMELRVPQDKLEATLAAIGNLGTVRSRSIETEDVSTTLVDLQARLRNARKSEEALQEIMTRSGQIADVLAVSRELSAVRESIEQMSAQQQRLQSQVQYSTISVRLESTVAVSSTKPAFSRQLGNSWESATASVGDFTTDLLQLGLWLLVYSPYIAMLLVGVAIARKMATRSTQR
jgi:hypothetical protein